MNDRLNRAIAAFDRANSEDPNKLLVDGVEQPRELAHSRRLSWWVEKLEPNASEPARLAARCQHIQRWKVPRDSYPEGRAGYLKWRTELQDFHAKAATAILRECGYDEATINRVDAILHKRALRSNPDAQLLEDALCLVFLEFQLDEMIAKAEPGKLKDILLKTWNKMSERGRNAALTLNLPSVVVETLSGS